MMANRAQCCAIFGWSPREFDQNVASGLPAKKKTSSRGETWAVDTVAAVTWTVARAMAEAGMAAFGAAPLDLDAERARLAKEQADRTAMENERQRGRLVDAYEVKEVVLRCV